MHLMLDLLSYLRRNLVELGVARLVHLQWRNREEPMSVDLTNSVWFKYFAWYPVLCLCIYWKLLVIVAHFIVFLILLFYFMSRTGVLTRPGEWRGKNCFICFKWRNLPLLPFLWAMGHPFHCFSDFIILFHEQNWRFNTRMPGLFVYLQCPKGVILTPDDFFQLISTFMKYGMLK